GRGFWRSDSSTLVRGYHCLLAECGFCTRSLVLGRSDHGTEHVTLVLGRLQLLSLVLPTSTAMVSRSSLFPAIGLSEKLMNRNTRGKYWTFTPFRTLTQPKVTNLELDKK